MTEPAFTKPAGIDDARYVVGIDMGGTNTEYAIIDRRGNIVGRDRIPTCGHDGLDAYVEAIRDGVEALRKRLGLEGAIAGVGIGAPAANQATGCIELSTNLPWPSPVPLRATLEEKFGVPAAITNDANAAAAGEGAYGKARGLKNFIVITLGTGVGSGIVCDGHLLSGSRGFAGELGHVIVDYSGERPCGCGRSGCLETFCSARGIVTTAEKMLAASSRPSSLRSLAPGELSAKTISEAAQQGDEIAREIYDFTGRMLGKACANFAAYTDPEAIVLFGGVSKAGDLIIKPMREALEADVLHLYGNRIQIVCSGLPDAEAALLGASAVAWDAADRR